MPRKPRNPGSGKAPVNTPARGAGWGGGANGAGRGGEKRGYDVAPFEAFTSDNQPRRNFTPNDQVEALKDLWWSIATNKDEPTLNRITAADKLYDRLRGKAVQAVMQAEVPLGKLSNDQLDRAIAEIESALGGRFDDAEGGTDQATIGKSSGFV